jgi:Short C-terminal domain
MRINCRERIGAIAGAALLAGACMGPGTGTGLTQLSADTYRISRVDGVGRYPDAEAMKAAVAEEASAYARGQGKVAVPISTHQETMRAGHLSTVEYVFRLAAPGEPAATAAPQGPAIASVASAAPAVAAAAAEPEAKAAEIPVAAPAPQAGPTSTPEAKPDLYNELIMLDDLRKRGILTDAEFQALKTKLLAGK